jgi:hypothetical protein
MERQRDGLAVLNRASVVEPARWAGLVYGTTVCTNRTIAGAIEEKIDGVSESELGRSLWNVVALERSISFTGYETVVGVFSIAGSVGVNDHDVVGKSEFHNLVRY